MQETCNLCGQIITVLATKDWDTYLGESGKQNHPFVGLRCSHCGAVFCNHQHQKELKFKGLKGGYRSGTCQKCGTSLQNSDVLLGETQESTFGLTNSSIAQGSGYIYGEKIKTDFDKHRKSHKTSLIIAGVGTAWLFIAVLLTVLVSALFEENSDSVMSVLMPIIIIPGLGFYAWIFVIIHFIQKKKAGKALANLPEPGRQRFEYIIMHYQKIGWNLLSPSTSEDAKVRLQEKKKFNIFLALLGIMFGLIGFFFYLAEYNKPGAIIELEQMPEGTVKVTAVTGS